MPRKIDKIKKAKVKHARLQGKSKAESLREGGYSKATAEHHAHDIPVLNCVDSEIVKEMKRSDYDVNYLLKKTSNIIDKAETKKDYTNALRGLEGIAKIQSIGADDKTIVNVHNVAVDTNDKEALTHRIREHLRTS